MWSQNNADDTVMAGDPGALIMANGYAFGATNFDQKTALQVLTHPPATSYSCSDPVVFTPGSTFVALGYLTDQYFGGSGATSTTLVLTNRDYAVAMFAKAQGDDAHARVYRGRAGTWRYLYTPYAASGPMQLEARGADGSWSKPMMAPADKSDTIEGSSEQYLWDVPYAVPDLASALGGSKAFVSRLDTFFTQINAGQTSAELLHGERARLRDAVGVQLGGRGLAHPIGPPSARGDDVRHHAGRPAWQRRPRRDVVLARLGHARHVPRSAGGRRIRAREPDVRQHARLFEQRPDHPDHGDERARPLPSKRDGQRRPPRAPPGSRSRPRRPPRTSPTSSGPPPPRGARRSPIRTPPSQRISRRPRTTRGSSTRRARTTPTSTAPAPRSPRRRWRRPGSLGAPFTVDGLTFAWPKPGVDNVVPVGQTITFASPITATKLGLLGTAVNGASSGTLTVTTTAGATIALPSRSTTGPSRRGRRRSLLPTRLPRRRAIA